MLTPSQRRSYIWSALLLGVFLGATVTTGRAQVYLFGRGDFGDGGEGVGMAAGDFNGDGRTDFAVTFIQPGGPDFFGILLGQPDGTLTVGQWYTTGTTPNSITAGDFNRDGKLDLAVGNAGDNTVSIYLGNGDGTFSGPVTLPTGLTPWWIITGDFNGDGKLDIATSGGPGSTVSVLLGNGDGTFNPHVDSPTLPYAIALAAGDFNGDGKLDLVVGAANAFCILLGKGDGTFEAPAQVAAFAGAHFAVGDYNGDGVLDIASLDSNGGGVTIFLGKGDGTFQAGAQYAPPQEFCNSILAGDFNHDGKLDLAFTSFAGSLNGIGTHNMVSVLLGKGDGTFQARADYGTGPGPDNVVAADLNGDGHLDLVVADSLLKGPGQTQTVSVLLGRGDGTFSEAHKDYPAGTPGTGVFTGVVFLGDFNGDGKPDLGDLVTDSDTDIVHAVIFLSKGDGTFQAPKSTTLGTFGGNSIYGPLTGDFNNDGNLDLALAVPLSSSASQLLVFLGKGDGTFQTPISTSLPQIAAGGLAVGDFNGDGKLDVAYTNGSNQVAVLLGRGNGSFGAEQDFATGTPSYSLIAADLNGDGKLDLVVGLVSFGAGPSLSILLGHGDGTFPTHADIGQGNAFALAVGDINGDGKPDLVLPGLVMLGNGDGTFQTAQPYDSDLSIGQIVVADMNGDGKMDIVTADTSDATFSVRYGKGDGTFSRAVAYFDPGFGSLTVGDFNGDGAVDLAVPSPANAAPAISVYLNSPTVALYPGSLSFGIQTVESTSAAQEVTLNNPGSMPLTITGVAAGGDFGVVNSCGSSLAIGANCNISVSFTPSADGVRDNSLQVTDNAPGSPQTLVLSGTGAGGPVVTLSAVSLTYTGQLVGSTSSAQAVTLTNSGNAALTISSIAASGDFAQTNTCGSSVAAGANCAIHVTFTPTTAGSRSGTLTITDNAGGSPQTAALSGTGTDFTAAPATGSSTSATVTAGGTATYTLAFTGTPGFTGTVSLTCAGEPSLATCTVSPSSLPLNGTTAANATVSVTTTSRSIVAPRTLLRPPTMRTRPIPIWPCVALAMLALYGAAVALRASHGSALLSWAEPGSVAVRWRLGLATGLLFLAVLATLAMPACGGGGGGGGGGNPGTPAGSYTLTVTARVTSGTATLTHTTNLTLTVN